MHYISQTCHFRPVDITSDREPYAPWTIDMNLYSYSLPINRETALLLVSTFKNAHLIFYSEFEYNLIM